LCSMLRLYQVQSDVIWPFVIAILDPLERLKFVQNYSACNFIQTLKVGSLVNASGLAFNKEVFYDCIVRFIGLVDEMGPGYYFGLELLVNYFFFLYFFFVYLILCFLCNDCVYLWKITLLYDFSPFLLTCIRFARSQI
jgi:hypothetical protein